MKKTVLRLLMPLMVFLTPSCSDDDDNGNGDNNGSSNGANIGTFQATVSGDLEEEIEGIAYYETVDGDLAITLFVSFNEWPFITFLFNPPVTERTYTVIGTGMGQDDNETNASASNGNFFFFGDGGSVTITSVNNDVINGTFDVDFEYSDPQETVNININGSFSAEED